MHAKGSLYLCTCLPAGVPVACKYTPGGPGLRSGKRFQHSPRDNDLITIATYLNIKENEIIQVLIKKIRATSLGIVIDFMCLWLLECLLPLNSLWHIPFQLCLT